MGALVAFEDTTDGAGIRFQVAGEVHGVLVEGYWPAFPEIMGSGACWFDADGDGYDDLFLVNQVYNAENPNVQADWARAADPHGQLYHNNDGDGTFRDVTADAGVDARGWGYGCSAADYDGDGAVDLFVATYGDNLLFHNDGDGIFTNATSSSGLAMTDACGEFLCMSTSSAWADYDHDGDLDLYVANYVDTDTTDRRRGPVGHNGQLNFLHRNGGDGTFTEVANQAGVQGNPTDTDGSKSLGVVWFDFDLDGDLDLFVANDEAPADLYANNGDGTFTERSDASGLDDGRGNMGLATGDYDNDGLADVFITHYKGEDAGFYRNNGDGTFEDRSAEDDLVHAKAGVGWGTTFVDFDRDMDLDLMAVNGHTEWSTEDYAQRALAFRNDPPLPGAVLWDRQWTDVSDLLGSGWAKPRVGRGAAWADFDLDGDTDLVIVPNGNETAALLQASGPIGGNGLTLRLRQPGANAFGIGARVVVEAGGLTQVREVQAGSSYLSQNTLDLGFGLGPFPQADRVTVQWPGGGSTTLTDLAAGQVLRIDRSLGTAVNDTLAPVTRAALTGTAGFGGWWVSPVEATLSTEDRGVTWASGVMSTEWSLDAGPWTPYTGTIPLGEGRHALRTRSTDHAGNREPPRVSMVWVDLTPPSLAHRVEGTQGEQGWWVSPIVSVVLDATDHGSGIGSVRYRLDGGAWNHYLAPFDLFEEGVHRVEYLAEDLAGNAAAAQSFEVRLDATPPEVALQRPEEGTVYLGDQDLAHPGSGPPTILAAAPATGLDAATFTLRAHADDATSGLAGVTFLVDGVPLAPSTGASPAAAWAVGREPTGLHMVAAVARDAAGNTAVQEVQVLLASAAFEAVAVPA